MIESLNEAFCTLPGVGKKTAQRFVYHLLERNREGGLNLAKALVDAMEHVKHCSSCRTLSEKDICNICANNNRTNTQLCIVETPTDIHAIEQSSVYKGKYFVLSGYLSPIDGIGAAELGLDELEQKLHQQDVEEIILATNATIEGEVTAHYISNMAKHFDVRITRIAHGLPIGGELEYADINTIAHALSGRKDYGD
ncbi:Recombination protein RecR [Bathymodiolus thermophilus thioautotrophic gill symbiont]|uniref:Recombination protein RecR n=1 Tax=Bathymodiolus thermophilus thioautotrophic gill symbiont TaxID=2360 RepID=A0A1J5UG92_9GAMM|nr:recombination mediator RecR [Bathymodiolus thermophilus thioautotrophic gill symbiont]AYQ56564.1 Recombination protein RecR [Bathymodiolus thermophilus thioautotrophic gill symbiont]OIR24941.1 recombination protein RecR [Bathymodiolus thermophilus thioautotrophic gill symbiont]CAB5494899.1 Recombination protein RecR [Bathymodiolus thermophilus thioautotrophic gill symbiont]SHA08558.1 Recombination protein RecR [Bathymodiolus thermophilus thioautotrophic gill symbiont]